MSNKTYIDVLYSPSPEVLSDLGKAAATLAYYNFEWRFLTLILFNTMEYVISLETFLKYYDKSAFVAFRNYRPPDKETLSQFVIFCQEAYELSEVIRWLISSDFNRGGKYIIVCSTIENDKCDELLVFKTVSKLLVPHVIYLKSDNKSANFQTYTYQIIESETCRNDKPLRLNVSLNCPNDDCFKSQFLSKLNDFHRCPLIVSTFDQPPFMYIYNDSRPPGGFDGDLLSLVTNLFNASLVIKTPVGKKDLGHYENNNWTGSLGDLHNGRAIASVCSAPLTVNNYGNFQISTVYNSMDIVWVSKLPLEQPSWEKLLHPFNIYVRYLLVLVFVVIAIITSFMRTHIWKETTLMLDIASTKSSIFFYSWVVLMGIPVTRIPTRTPVLIILTAWILFCYVIRSSYQAALIDALRHTDYQDTLDSFDMAKANQHPYGGMAYLREFYSNDPEVLKQWKVVDFENSNRILHEIFNGTSEFVLAINKDVIRNYLIKSNGRKQLHVIPEKIVNSPTVMYLRKHSALADPLNLKLSALIESGFTQRLHAQFLRSKNLLQDRSGYRGPEPLTVGHFLGSIILLIFGWIVSIIFFCIEYYIGRL